MKKRRPIEVDHVDPVWEPHRHYQLVCGLPDNPHNLCIRDGLENMSKGNRFLPWRWSINEIGVVPQFKGDLCLFLDPDTGEWVLEEFLGEWWVEKSRETDGRRFQPNNSGPRKKGVSRNKGVHRSPVRSEFYRVVVWKELDPDLTYQTAFRRLVEECSSVDPSQKKTFERVWKEHGWEITRIRDGKGRFV